MGRPKGPPAVLVLISFYLIRTIRQQTVLRKLVQHKPIYVHIGTIAVTEIRRIIFTQRFCQRCGNRRAPRISCITMNDNLRNSVIVLSKSPRNPCCIIL